jgi:sugar transferase (PEP-CTERM system associated)
MLRLFKQYYPARNAVFVIGEGLFIFLSVIISSCILLDLSVQPIQIWMLLKALLIAAVCQACLYYNDLYDLEITDTLSELSIRLLQALGAAAILLAGVYTIFPQCIIGRGIFVISIAFVIFFIVTWRIAYTQILNKGMFNQKVLLIGGGALASDIIGEIDAKRDCGYEISGVTCTLECTLPELQRRNDFSPATDYFNLAGNALKKGVKKIVVALEERRGSLPVKELLKCRTAGIEVLEGSSFYEMLTGKLLVKRINPGWLIFSEGFQRPWLTRKMKRAVDIMMSSLMLVVLSPLMAIVAIWIKLDSPGSAIYSQERVGAHRRAYKVHKFRSMRQDAEKHTGPVWAQTDDDRVTKIGHFIRKWRIDELPQLWNVLKGEMSFVGPRPEREHFVKELEAEIPYYGERFTVKPGLTGWAQVSYSYGASVDDAIEKLNYDLFYIKNMSIFMDLMVIMRTVKTVIFGEGAR